MNKLIKHIENKDNLNVLAIFNIIIISIIGAFISTNHKISLFFIGLLFLFIVSTIFLRTNKKYIYILTILILLNESLFYLTPKNLSSIVAIISLILFIFRFNVIIKKRYLFKNSILVLVLISFISQLGSFFRFNQPIILGIFGMHFIFIYLYYFFFVDFLENKIKFKNIDILIKVFISIGTIMSILYILQMIIYPKFIIFNMSYSYRNGSVRFFTGYIFVMFSIVLTYSKLLEKLNIRMLICILIQLASLISVSKTRNFIIAIIIVFVIGLCIKNRNNKLIFSLMVGLLAIIGALFIKDNILFKMIDGMYFEFKTQSNTIGARIYEFKYYIELLKQSPLTGIGFLDSRFELTPIITGYYPYFYFVEDLGLIGCIIKTGLIGAIWMIVFLWKMFKVGKKNIYLKSPNLYLMILTLVLIIGAFASGLIFDKTSIMYICLFLAISEVSLKYKLNKLGDN